MEEISPSATVIENAEGAGKPDLGPTSAPDNGPYQKLVEHCKELYDAFSKSSYREKKIKEIEQSRKVYEQTADKKTMPWDDASNLVLPLTAITVDNLEPRLVSGLTGRDPIVRLEPEGMTEKDEPTKILEQWFNQTLKNDVKVEAKAIGLIHTILLEGTWYGIPSYDRQEITRRDYVFDQRGQIAIHPKVMTNHQGIPLVDPQTGQMVPNPQALQPKTQDRKELLYEGGQIEQVPFTDVLCADNIGTPEEWETCDKGVIIRPTYAELMRDKGKTGYLSDKIGPWLVGQKTGKKISDKDQTPDDKVMGIEVTGKEVIPCVNWYLTYPINRVEEEPETEQSDFTEERILATVTMDSGVLIRIGLLRDFSFSNECPVKRVRLFPEAGRSYGTSMYGKMKSIQDGASDFFNTILNISVLCMIPWYFYEEAAGLRGDTELYPGKGVPVDSVAGIKIPDFFKLNPANYLVFIQTFMDLWERLGSISNPQIGRPDDKQKTATEIMTVVQEGNIKYDYQSRTSKDEFISVLKCLYDLYYQYMPFDKKFIVNGQPVPIPRQAMKQKVKFVLTGSTATANRMIERKEAEELDTLAAGNPLMNPMKTLEDRLKAYGKYDTAAYIKPEIRQLLAAFMQNPEITQVVGKYLQDKQQIAGEAQGAIGAAKANMAQMGAQQ